MKTQNHQQRPSEPSLMEIIGLSEPATFVDVVENNTLVYKDNRTGELYKLKLTPEQHSKLRRYIRC